MNGLSVELQDHGDHSKMVITVNGQQRVCQIFSDWLIYNKVKDLIMTCVRGITVLFFQTPPQREVASDKEIEYHAEEAIMRVLLYKGKYVMGFSEYNDLQVTSDVMMARKYGMDVDLKTIIRYLCNDEVWIHGQIVSVRAKDLSTETFKFTYEKVTP